MRTRDRIKLVAGTALLLALPSIPPDVAAQRPASPLVLIVAENSPLTDVSLSMARALFSGDLVTVPGVGKLTPLNQPTGTPDRLAFDRVVLRMGPEQVGNFWVNRRLRGLGHPPRVTGSPRLAILFAARFPGAVTYVRASQLAPGVRALLIDGKRHDDPAYPLGDPVLQQG